MLSLLTRGLVCGPQIFCDDAMPCDYQEDIVTDDRQEGPHVTILTDSSSDTLVDLEFKD